MSLRAFFWAATLAFWLSLLARAWWPQTAAPQRATEPVPARLTLAQVALHDRPQDCWMVIEGWVVDLSAYLDEHPADPALLRPWCGRDASQAYRTKLQGRAHSARADRLLAGLRIGQLER